RGPLFPAGVFREGRIDSFLGPGSGDMTTWTCIGRVAVALALLLAAFNASAATGTGTFVAVQRVHVQYPVLTTDLPHSAVNVTLSLNADGTFTASVGVENTYEGTYSSSGTVYKLMPDADSQSALLQFIRSECACSPIAIRTVNWRVKINK